MNYFLSRANYVSQCSALSQHLCLRWVFDININFHAQIDKVSQEAWDVYVIYQIFGILCEVRRPCHSDTETDFKDNMGFSPALEIL